MVAGPLKPILWFHSIMILRLPKGSKTTKRVYLFLIYYSYLVFISCIHILDSVGSLEFLVNERDMARLAHPQSAQVELELLSRAWPIPAGAVLVLSKRDGEETR